MAPSPSDAGRSLFQNTIYIGYTLQDILCGMELVLYFKTIHVLLANKGVRKRLNLFYALFSTMMVLCVTVWTATSAFFGEKMWLLDANFSGGPDAFFDANISAWYMDWGTTSFVLLQLMTDGLMIYRCRVIWNSNRVIIVPILLWLYTFVFGVLVDWSSSLPGGNFFVGVASRLALAYYVVAVLLNTMLTGMICYRIVRYGRDVREHLGHEHASFYFDVVALVVEAVLPYTLSGIAFLVSFGVGSSMSQIFLPLYVFMMCISPQMLILRVIDGKAWNDMQDQPVSAIRFSTSNPARSELLESEETVVNLQTLPKAYLQDGYSKVPISSV